jgi:ribosomal protein S18 acetylase RimI-like enzyme
MPIRKVTDLEFSLLVNLLTFLTDKYTDPNMIKTYLAKTGAEYFGYYNGSDLVGIICLEPQLNIHGWTAEIKNLIIHPKSRGQGIGEELTKYILQYARNKGYGSIYLIAGEDRMEAKGLYKKLGFKPKSTGLYYDLKESKD